MRSLFSRALLAAVVLTVVPPAASVQILSVPEVVDATVPVQISGDTLSLTSTAGDAPEAHRSDPIAAPLPFSMIGFRVPEGVDTVRVRAAGDDGEWGEWYEAERVDASQGPDPDSADAAADRSNDYTEPVFVGEASRFQIAVPADVVDGAVDVDVSATVLDTDGLSGGPVEKRTVSVQGPVAEAASAPKVITRSQWGAAAPKGSPSYSSKVDMTVVHHTAGSNNYTASQAPGIMRGMQSWHMNNNGWKDLGYNLVVDRFGNVYEGRAGGIERAVVGAHAAGYNSASFGVSVIGNFTSVDAPQAAYNALVQVIGWKSSLHGMDPLGTTSRTAKGAKLRTVSGHKDMGNTTCPGKIQDRLWWIRTEAAKLTSQPSSDGASSGSGSATPARQFPDVTVADHRANVLTAHEHNVLLGYQDNTFLPAEPLNRGDMARAVAISLGIEPATNWKGRFNDIEDKYWLAPYIVALADTGVVQGYDDGSFRPGEPLQRDQMASFLTRALELQPRTPSFTDVPRSNHHYHAIGAVEAANITKGVTATQYGPSRTMRRDQSASLLVRAFDIG